MSVASELRWSPPELFDDYRIVRFLGRGGMGHVYLAWDTVLERTVAIKFIRSSLAEDFRDRFLIEARALARLQHPNVVTVYRVGETDHRPYLVSEFVRGQSLDSLPAPLTPQGILEVALGCARGLAAAHRRGVLHRDIKPANLILSSDGEVKILDFGLASLSASGDAPGGPPSVPIASTSHTGFGTPLFMAPEVWTGADISPRADIYSLGAVLYTLCVGHPPHMDGDLAEMCAEVAATQLVPITSTRPDIDAKLGHIIDRCLRAEPSERYSSADEMYLALEELTLQRRARQLPEGNPYRGLHAFEAEHRALFFGRNSETAVIKERLRSESFILVAADSGVGKSSLCRAGVLPEVTSGALGQGRAWATIAVTPGQHPLTAVAASLAPLLGMDEANLVRQIELEGASLCRELRKRLGRTSGLLLFLDQMEELVTLSRPEEAQKLSEFLSWLIAAAPGVRLLGTVRSDFLTRLASLPGLGSEISRALYILQPLSRENIREAVAGPAAAKEVRFESDAMVEGLVDSGAAAEGGLPLLQFALAELWERRDVHKHVITQASLDAMGGVTGALARHADEALAALRPHQRLLARRMLPQLVTINGTRARRTEPELVAGDASAHDVLSALVRARLLVARESEAGSAYEVAHEALIRGWPTLARWLDEDSELRAARDRVARSTADWIRLGERPDALWGRGPLKEVSAIEQASLTADESRFLSASESRLTRVRRVRMAGVVAVFLALLAVYAGLKLRARSELKGRVASYVNDAQDQLGHANEKEAALVVLRGKAFAEFDAARNEQGEELWQQVRQLSNEADRLYSGATQGLETALSLDRDRTDISRQLSTALLQRARLADEFHRPFLRDELLARMSIFDPAHAIDASRRQMTLELVVPDGDDSATGAEVSLQRYESRPDGAMVLSAPTRVGIIPFKPMPLAAGSYVVELKKQGHAGVRWPFVATASVPLHLRAHLPLVASIPSDFAFIPTGRFMFGSAAEEALRVDFLNTVPSHAVDSPAFLIARHETTYAEWIAFLDSLPPEERQKRMPHTPGRADRGMLQLSVSDTGVWTLQIQPTDVKLHAVWGQPLNYRGRKTAITQDWSKLPVTGVDSDDVEAYAAWLRRTGKVPGARPCTELEWERAAKGADEREFPHGDRLLPSDANFDETYGKIADGFGLDEVGSHSASRSPFGLDDMSGNAWEWTKSFVPGEWIARGGSFYFKRNAARITNREAVEPSLRDVQVGVRLCASYSAP